MRYLQSFHAYICSVIKVLLISAFLLGSLASVRETIPFTSVAKQQEVDSIVYITRNGKKYHKEGCQYLSKSKLTISLREALENRYEPCKRCYKDTARDSLTR
jgi:hypothetical protein